MQGSFIAAVHHRSASPQFVTAIHHRSSSPQFSAAIHRRPFFPFSSVVSPQRHAAPNLRYSMHAPHASFTPPRARRPGPAVIGQRPSSRPRVALDCRASHWPGIARYCAGLGAALVRVAPDLRFTWLSDRASAPVWQALARRDDAVLVLASRPPQLHEQIEVPLALARARVDLLHAPAAQSLPLAAPRLVVTVHDLILKHHPGFHAHRPARWYYDLMHAVAMRRACHLIAVSHHTRDDVLARWPMVAGRISAVWNGVGAQFRRVADAARLAQVRQRHRLPANYLLYVGTRKRHKNLVGLLHGYARLQPALRARAPLVLLAPPDARYPEVEAAARLVGVGATLHWLARVDDADMAVLYTLARAVVQPSLLEGFGFPVAEAQACGTPAAVAAVAALPEVGGAACVQFDPSDPDAIATALLPLIEDDDLHARLSQEATRAARRFDWEASARTVAGIYRQVLA